MSVIDARLGSLAVGLFVATLVSFGAPSLASAQSCTVCDTCTEDAECGVNGICVDFGSSGQRCTAFCDTQACPGNSRCFTVSSETGEEFQLCLNNDASTELCPSSYSCSDQRTCNGLGNDCANMGAACSPDNELCINDGSGNSFCSCYCNTDQDCGQGNSCVTLSDGQRACAEGDVPSSPCDGVQCPGGQVCDPSSGACVAGGGCPGLGNDCVNSGEFCSSANDVCLVTDPDSQASYCSCTCVSDADCGANGTCEVLNEAGDSACVFGGGGPPEDLCENVQCPQGAICSPATGTCIGGMEDFGTADMSMPQDTAAPQDTTAPPMDATVVQDTVSTTDGFVADQGPTSTGSNGCGCSTRHQDTTHWPLPLGLGLALFGLVWRRRRDG